MAFGARPMAIVQRIDTPLGGMNAVISGRGLRLLDFEDRPGLDARIAEHLARPASGNAVSAVALGQDLRRQLDEYFIGRRGSFEIALHIAGSPFQMSVWQALQRVPYASTISYRELAQAAGRPRAIRAVGHANALNPIAILIPCHRVIGSDGDLRGYGGGLWRKRALLELENRAADHNCSTTV